MNLLAWGRSSRLRASLLGVVWVALVLGVLHLGLPFMPDPIGPRSGMLLDGARTTFLLTLLAGTVGLLIGIFAGVGQSSTNQFIRKPIEAYIWIIRGTPLLVQILFVHFAFPSLFPMLSLTAFESSALALALNVGAYNAEVIRAGILAVNRGQVEAARSLGLSSAKTMRFVVLPQAVSIVIPPLMNNVIALLKDSSLASAIGLLEVSLAGQRITSETFRPVPVLSSVAFIYLVLTTTLTGVMALFERKNDGQR